MRSTHRAAFTALVAAGLLIAACGSDSKSESTSASAPATTAGAATTTAAGAATTAAASGSATTAGGAAGSSLVDGKIPCNQQYKGKKVTLFSSIRDIEADKLVKAYEAFEKCTGADVEHEGSGEFEAQLKV